MTRKRRRTTAAAGTTVLFLPFTASWSLFHIPPPKILRQAAPPVWSQPRQYFSIPNSDRAKKGAPADESFNPKLHRVAPEEEEDGFPGIGAFEMDPPNATKHQAVPPPRRKSKQPEPLFFFPSTQSKPPKTHSGAKQPQPVGHHTAGEWTKRKQPDDVITYAELQHILDRLDALPSTRTHETDSSTRQRSKQKEKSGVAFPQPSVLSYKNVAYGAMTAASVLGALVGGSILPKLWLVSGLLGGGYGYHVGTTHSSSISSPHFVQTLVLAAGRKLAKLYLQVYDYFQTIFFMFKTGQLSYEYYKRYELLDDKFQIQSKLDAWNRRFVEGKRNFDQWEQQNEIGRKILAGLRTAWLVEERSLRKTSHYTSKYRLIQLMYDGSYRVGKILGRLWETLLGRNEPLREFSKGVYRSSNRRLRGIVAALVAVNLTGAIFAISPKLLCGLAILFGYLWPSWMEEFVNRTAKVINETRASGRGESHSLSQKKQSPRPAVTLLWKTNFKKDNKQTKRTKYGSFKRTNGKKKYYRAGQRSWFGKQQPNKHFTRKISWPWINHDSD